MHSFRTFSFFLKLNDVFEHEQNTQTQNPAHAKGVIRGISSPEIHTILVKAMIRLRGRQVNISFRCPHMPEDTFAHNIDKL